MNKPEWPKTFKSGSAAVKVYRAKHKKTKSGWVYTVAYVGTDGKRRLPQFADPDEAIKEAKAKADAIGKGRPEIANLSRSDLDELRDLRALAKLGNTPPIAAMQEWWAAHQLAGGELLAAARAWGNQHTKLPATLTVTALVDDFIAAKEALGFQGEQTYRRKLSPFVKKFGEREAASITEAEFTEFLSEYPDEGSRNDRRARLLTMYKWAKAKRKLPNVPLEIQATDRAKETLAPIGIINSDTFLELLSLVRKEWPQDLAALVLAGFCGIRSDEIHGKREDRTIRQTWEDVFIDRKFVRVTNAKENTPDDRFTPLCPAAIAWLKLCPKPHSGVICEAKAVERIRRTGINAGLSLPKNCFRHSYISHRIAALDGNKPQVATEAGTSVAKIDQRYRVPLTKAEGLAWFEVWPGSPMKEGA